MVISKKNNSGNIKKKAVLILLFALYFLPITNAEAFAKKPKRYTAISNYKYQQKILRKDVKEKYLRSLLPQSGYMTVEEYEQASAAIFNADKTVPEYKLPKDIKMKYVPQPIYQLTRYNKPPGSAELHIDRNLQFNRQFICPGITSPQKDILVYPTVYYYAANQCTSCDLHTIPLDKSLPDVERIKRANIVKRNPEPILSTDKTINEKFTFRTLTPVDFSADGTRLVVKEKVGNVNDGIWQTNLWVYDFNTQTAKKLPEIREAIRFYWKNSEHLNLAEKRWDIKPLGFDANDPERIVVSAYGYTGGMPHFLGTWSIDYDGNRAMLLSLFEESANIGMNGYKLEQKGVVDPVTVYNDEKKQDKITKKNRKLDKKQKRKEKSLKKKAYKATIKQMKRQESKTIREMKKQFGHSGPTEIQKYDKTNPSLFKYSEIQEPTYEEIYQMQNRNQNMKMTEPNTNSENDSSSDIPETYVPIDGPVPQFLKIYGNGEFPH